MGTRKVLVDPQFLIELLKSHDSRERTYTVRNPLPDDAKYSTALGQSGGIIALLVESQEWIGDSADPVLPIPEVLVHLGDER